MSATAKGLEKMREGERQRTNERFAFVRLSRATATAANRRKVALLRDHKIGSARACLCEGVGQLIDKRQPSQLIAKCKATGENVSISRLFACLQVRHKGHAKVTRLEKLLTHN